MERRRFSGAAWFGGAVLLAAAGVRVWQAWTDRVLVQPDPTVVALMAKHMAEGTDWPVFFYGQSYMGSLEPMASALFAKLMGPTGFAVALGTVFFAMVAIALLGWWGRKAGGAWCGAVAMAAALFGPQVFLSFQSEPRGGYMAALAADAFVLAWAAPVAAAWWKGRRVAAWRLFALGAAAGLGLWTDLIVVPALCAALLVLAVGMRGRFWRHWGGLAAGVGGTLLGAVPWLLYNLKHGWLSLELPHGVRQPLRVGILNAWHRFLMFQTGIRTAFGWNLASVLAVLSLALAAAGIAVWLAHLRKRDAERNFAIGGTVAFCALFAAAFAVSSFNQFNTGRYWVPVAPGLAVLAAVACTAEGWRFRRWTCGAALAVLVGLEGWISVANIRAEGLRVPEYRKGQLAVEEGIRRSGAEAVLAPNQWYQFNFSMGEEVAVSDGRQKFHVPTLARADLAENVAYSAGWRGITHLMDRLSVPIRQEKGGIVLAAGRPPAKRCVLAAAGAFAEGTEWEIPCGEAGAFDSIQIMFEGEGAGGENLPRGIDFDVKENGAWRAAGRDLPLLPLTWSGTRAYLSHGREQEFPVKSGGAEAVRIRFNRMRRNGCTPGVVFFHRRDPGAAEGTDERDPVATAAALAEDGAPVFAPRWISNRLLRAGIGAERLPGVNPYAFHDGEDMAVLRRFPEGRPLVVVTEARHLDAALDLLRQAGVRTPEPDGIFPASLEGEWAVFRLEAQTSSRPLRWNGSLFL